MEEAVLHEITNRDTLIGCTFVNSYVLFHEGVLYVKPHPMPSRDYNIILGDLKDLSTALVKFTKYDTTPCSLQYFKHIAVIHYGVTQEKFLYRLTDDEVAQFKLLLI